MAVLGKDRILGVDVASAQNTKRVHYGIIIFVVWICVVAAAVTFFILNFAHSQQDVRLDLGIREPWFQRRRDWKALPEFGTELFDLPLSFVLIGHSAVDMCTERYTCIRDVLEMQSDHHKRGWYDIGPNFLVGGNGDIFEGRGANIIGVMASSWNRLAVSVMFLGNYVHNEPTAQQFENVNFLLKEMVKHNVIKPDYTLLGHCQAVGNTIPPGPNIMDNMHHFEHWNSENRTLCLRR